MKYIDTIAKSFTEIRVGLRYNIYFDVNGHLNTSLYDKRDNFFFQIHVNSSPHLLE